MERSFYSYILFVASVLLGVFYYHSLEKYNIVERPLPEISPYLISEKKKHSFKYTKATQMKAIHRRMCSFIRMVDFIVLDMLRTLIMTAINVIQKQISSSFTCDEQLDLQLICGWKADLPILRVPELLAKPLFEVELILNGML